DPVQNERVHLLDVLRCHPLRGVEALDLAGDAGREARGVEVGDRADAGAAADDPVPARLQVVAERRKDAKPGDGDATFRHVSSSLVANARGRKKRPRQCVTDARDYSLTCALT